MEHINTIIDNIPILFSSAQWKHVYIALCAGRFIDIMFSPSQQILFFSVHLDIPNINQDIEGGNIYVCSMLLDENILTPSEHRIYSMQKLENRLASGSIIPSDQSVAYRRLL